MAQLFPQWSNTLARVVFASVLSLPILIPALLMIGVRVPYATGVGIPKPQPVPFSHKHHVGDMNIDCRYCHAGVEQSPFAGLPQTKVCMTCHSQLFSNADMLAPVRQSLQSNRPLRWTRVNNLPDHVYFDHSIHIHKGVPCESCHGRVDRMPLTWPAHSFFMQFCLDCHRNPAPALRPIDQVTTMGWQDDNRTRPDALALLRHYDIQTQQLTDCSICHR